MIKSVNPSTGCCLYCGGPEHCRHHPTAGLTPDGLHLDPTWTIGLCWPCHRAEHAAWRSVGLDEITDPLLARLRRITWLVGRLRDLGRWGALGPDEWTGLHRTVVVCRDLVAERARNQP